MVALNKLNRFRKQLGEAAAWSNSCARVSRPFDTESGTAIPSLGIHSLFPKSYALQKRQTHRGPLMHRLQSKPVTSSGAHGLEFGPAC
jgi:hypothetical protein